MGRWQEAGEVGGLGFPHASAAWLPVLLGPEERPRSQERKPMWTQTPHRRTLRPCGVQGAPMGCRVLPVWTPLIFSKDLGCPTGLTTPGRWYWPLHTEGEPEVQRSRCLATQPAVSRLAAYMSLTPRLCFSWCLGGAGQRALRVLGDDLGRWPQVSWTSLYEGD